MAYLTPADFRNVSLNEVCQGLALDDQSIYPDAKLTSSISRFSERIDEYTRDHFESETLTLELDGNGTSQLILPKRCTAVSTIKTRDSAGTLTAQSSTVYRLHSSLYSSGTLRLGEFDWLEIVLLSSGLVGTSGFWGGPFTWPRGIQTVQVAGTFGWTSPPPDIKRAVALLVYDHFKPIADETRRASRWASSDTTFERAVPDPTGLIEVDEIIRNFRRDGLVAVA